MLSTQVCLDESKHSSLGHLNFLGNYSSWQINACTISVQFKVPIRCNTAISRHLCIYLMKHDTHYLFHLIHKLSISIFQLCLSVILTSMLRQVTTSLENTREDILSFSLFSDIHLRGFYLASFPFPIISHWKAPALCHATHTFFKSLTEEKMYALSSCLCYIKTNSCFIFATNCKHLSHI